MGLVRRCVEICTELGSLRFPLQSLAARDGSGNEALGKAIESCKEAARLRVELAVIERMLIELEQELTPLRPPSRTDIKAAFDAASDFASGKKKPPEKD